MKNFPSLFFVFLTSLLLSSVVSAASQYDSSERVASGIIATLGTGVSYDVPTGKVFSLDRNFGQDLYKLTYNRLIHESADLAVARTLTHRPFSKEELFAIVEGSNLAQILQKNPRESLTEEQIASRRREVLDDLTDQKDLADLEVITKMQIAPTEFFANGDESDSGFDLISDLDVIETILFGKTETTFGGSGPGAPAGSKVITAVPLDQEKTYPQKGIEETGPQVSAEPGKKPMGEKPLDAAISESISSAESEALCPLNSALHNAVARARELEKAEAERKKAKEGAKIRAGEGEEGVSGIGQTEKPVGGKPEEALTPESAANWARPGVCNETFCLKFEAVYKKDSSYSVSDNCIACHFEKINDAFKKTLDRNIVPSKHTGNLGEGSKCKRGLLGLKWNFVLISQPILTPPNDDLVIKGDFIKNFIEFSEKYFNNPGRCDALKEGESGKGAAGGACKPDKDPTEATASRVLEQAAPGTDQQKILEDIRTQVAAQKDAALMLLEQTRSVREGGDQASQYQVLLQEIDTMNAFFESFQKLYSQLISDEKDAPCNALASKEACS